jgi:glycosyltransferase involved in cell wall biosynthesis
VNIIHTIAGMGINSGGPTSCTYILVKGLIEADVQIKVLTFKPGENDRLITNEDFIETIKRPLEEKFGYSRSFKNALKKFKNVDLVHGNGLWQYSTFSSAFFSFKNKIPFVISPHGMLYPEALKNSKYLKKLMFFLYQKTILNKAAVIHATCKQEMGYVRALGIKTPVAVIPNPIDIKSSQISDSKGNRVKRIGFIGRFTPIKNIEILLEAWALSESDFVNCELVLIGDGTGLYKKSLMDKAVKLGIKNIIFTGFLSGKDKDKMVKTLSFVVLPSKSENFGMVVAEALINEIPVIASKGTPWEELNMVNAGWWIDIGVEPLKKALVEAIQISEEERVAMGRNGRKLIEEKYSMQSVAKQMVQLYIWVLTKKNKPDFVDIL